jgi:hypothetical protein
MVVTQCGNTTRLGIPVILSFNQETHDVTTILIKRFPTSPVLSFVTDVSARLENESDR